MQPNQAIEHQGIVEGINSSTVTVNILTSSGCTSCVAKGACNISETKEKIIEVHAVSDSFSIGEKVQVQLKKELGFRALFLGYILPFIVVLSTLLIVLFISDNEGIAGLSSLIILAPYYLILYFYRDNLKKQFSFSIRKQFN